MSNQDKKDFAKHITKYLSEYLPHERNLSPNTIVAYRDAFVLFIDFMKIIKNKPVQNIGMSDLNKENINAFLSWIVSARNCSIATSNYRLAALLSFVRYVQYIDIGKLSQWQEVLSIQPKKEAGRTLNYLTVDGIKLLLEQPDITTVSGRRHLAILSLLYDTGARVQELADLTIGSLRISSQPYTVRIVGKGRKIRIVPLMNEQVEILKTYIADYRLENIDDTAIPLFFNNRREKLSRAGITYILLTYASQARIINDKIIPAVLSCHSIRHSKAMHLLQAGVNLVYIRDILGHTSIQTTDIYARSDSKAKREALQKAYIDVSPSTGVCGQWETDNNLRNWLKGLQK
ncbi:MAG: site-specific integrase [Christensenellaceae bacterium]|jgi:site-specific recombinase XerD|nr:site-specific integrase [Christensenellaceae bacterium]